MKTKLFEVRDAGTLIPVLAVQFGSEYETEAWLLTQAGRPFQCAYVWLAKLSESMNGTFDPYAWPENNRTMKTAHMYILDHFDDLEPGAVVDVEYILRLCETAKVSERLIIQQLDD